MRKIYISVLAVILFSFKTFDSSTHSLAGGSFIQDWANTGLITVNDDWSGVTSIVGFLGQDITTTTGTNPQTLTGVSAVATDADVIVNQTTPNTLSTGGVAEFEITNPTIALNGSGTADAPHIIIYLNSSGRSNINVSYLLRDLDGSADNSIQPVALQYRIGNAGSFINVPAAFVADATSGPSLATLETPVNVVLPAACDNQSEVQVRIITANAVGNDEWVGIDNINISSDATATTTASVSAGVNAAEPSTNGTFIINLSSPAPAGGIVVIYSLTGSATIISDYTNPQGGTVTIAQNTSSATVNINVNDDAVIEGTESVQINLISATSPVTIGTATATINISDNDFPPNPYISLVNTYTQDFNSLANTGTTNSLSITGWLLNETGGSARDNEQYGADNGGSNTGDAYSYGTTATTDRALGGLQSGTLIPTFGAQIQNNSGTTITKLKISYTGEEWRVGTAARTDKLSFQYSTNATSLTNGIWTDVSALDFITPNTVSVGAKDGNNSAFRTSLNYTLRNLSIPNGSVFLIRWNDFNASGADDGLAVDDFTIEANPIDLTPPAIVSLTPANNATNLPINISASVQFNEDVLKGTGNIRLRRTSDNSIYQTININSVAVTVAASTIQIALNALAVNTQYYFEIDNGAISDLDGNPFAGISGNSTWTFTTGINFYVANFQTCTSGLTDGFTQYSVTGAIVWACTSFGRDPSAPAGAGAFPNAVQINGFANGTNVPNVDWLISPSFNLTGTNYPLLSFWSRTAFNGQPLQLKVSTDYISGDPTLATWSDINGKFPAQTSNIWTLSENINLTAFKQSNVHFAFVYVSDDDEGARWTLDDISLGNSPTPPPPSLTVSTNDIQFAFAASGTTADKQFSLTGNDLLNGITLNATGVFSLSKDGVSFSTSLNYTVAETNNISKTVYVRFAPTQNNQNFTGTVLIGSGSLAETVNLSGSSIDPVTTLEVVNWNIEWFGSSANGPANDAQQEQNVKTILQSLNADVYAVSEIVSEQRLASVVSQMPGYTYVISNYGSHTNTSVNPVGALAEAQKLAFIYKTSVLSNTSTTALVSAGINTAADIANPAYNYFASGRFPFMLSADVTLNCITKNVKFVLIHGKANTSPTATSYDRRKRGSDTLRYTLQQNYANDHVIILGDYNDDLDFTITAGINPPVTSYSAFTTDAVNFTALTLPLSLAGKKSTVSFNDVIDHVVASNDMLTYYMPATASILTDVTSLVSNYSGTTSDHFPVFTRYIFENKIAPTVTSCPVVSPLCTSTTNIFTIPLFTATDDCDAVTYSFEITGATQRNGNTNNASGLFNAGTSTIIWTASDNWGNSATCQTTVVVNISPSSVTIPDAYALPTGVLANTVYIGYSPASSLTLTSVVTGGTPSYTYNWSNGSIASSVTVRPLVTTTYTLTVTDANGCQATGSKTVNVIDIRGGNKNDKVTICHNSNSLVVAGSSIIAHLAHGDMLGSCNIASNFITSKSIKEENAEVLNFVLSARPNPTSSGFTIKIEAANSNDRISLRVTDVIGRTIELKNNLQPYESIKIGDRYHSGIYFAEVMQGNLKKVIKLVKL